MLKGGLEFPAEAIVAIGSHLFASLHGRMPVATSRAQAKGCWNGKHDGVLTKGLRTVNHRMIEPAPGNGHVQ